MGKPLELSSEREIEVRIMGREHEKNGRTYNDHPCPCYVYGHGLRSSEKGQKQYIVVTTITLVKYCRFH